MIAHILGGLFTVIASIYFSIILGGLHLLWTIPMGIYGLLILWGLFRYTFL